MSEQKQPLLIYKDKKGNEFYNAAYCPDALPTFHKYLMWFYIFYLFVLPSVAIVLTEMYFEGSPFFRLTGWLVLTMYVGFVINNYKMSTNKLKAAWQVLSIPLELFIFSLIFQWGWVVEVIEWSFIELIGFFIGMLIGTVFRVAPISLAHRILSFFIVLFLSLVVFGQFSHFSFVSFSNRGNIQLCVLSIPFMTAIYNYGQLFLIGEFGGKDDVNLGTAVLSQKVSPFLAIFAVLWLFLPSIGKAFS